LALPETQAIALKIIAPQRLLRVSFDYEAQNEDELTVRVGDIVTEVPESAEEPGWLKVVLGDGRQGLIPANFVLPAAGETVLEEDEAPQTPNSSENGRPPSVNLDLPTASGSDVAPQAVASFPWKARTPAQLSFDKGALITVLRKGDSWWWGELTGTGLTPAPNGWFPKAYVKLVRGTRRGPGSTGSTVSDDARRDRARTAPLKYLAKFSYEPVAKGELGFTVGDVVYVSDRTGTWWKGECKGARGSFPANYVKPL
jgi:hypothetical protein